MPRTERINTDIASIPVSLWVVEDDRAYREALCVLMDGSQGIRCEQSFSNCEDALKMLSRRDAPEVVLMDIHLGQGMNGIEGLKRTKEISPATDVIMLTNFDDDHDVFQAICAGATGYLKKNISLDDTVASITEVLNGGLPMNAPIARKVMFLFKQFHSTVNLGLTEREQEILKHVAEGSSKKIVADKLFITYRTVDTHIKNIYKKLNVHTIGEAVAKWLQSNPPKTFS